MEKNFSDIVFLTFLLSGLSYLALAGYLVIKKQFHQENFWLIFALMVSAVWSGSIGASFLGWRGISFFLPFLEILRGATWIIFFSALLSRIWAMDGDRRQGRKLLSYLFILLGVILFISSSEIVFFLDIHDFRLPARYHIYSALFLSIVIFLFIENLYRNSAAEGRWGIKLLLLGVAAIYLYDFILYADYLMFKAVGRELYNARGLMNFFIVPVIAVSVLRNPRWKLNIQLSRKVAFHTVTLIGAGAYLIGMSAAGYFIQNYTGEWGNILQVTFIPAALLGLIILFTSGKFRAWAQVLLTKHFFQYRYDYREEWLKFINTISASGEHYDLRERAIKTLGDVVDSPGGALWLSDRPDFYQLVAKWNFQHEAEYELPAGEPFIRLLEQEDWVVDLDNDIVDGKLERHDILLPEWLSDVAHYWLILPLNHLGKLVGFVILLQPRAKNRLNWESTDLLKTIGRQLASYLAEQNAEMALAESREFESFNRKFAFVVHDIKNLTSQLSLMIKNAEKHAGNPEFQKDMVLTVQNSVAKMNSLLSRITVVQEPAIEKNDNELNISKTMTGIIKRYHDQGLNISYDGEEEDIEVFGDSETVDTIFMHLIENAREACVENENKIEVELSCKREFAIIKVKDNGHGMAADFIKNELFRPFRSTKENGYGIGAYESREMVMRLGGKLDVKSEIDVGTTMTVYLRLAKGSVCAEQKNEGI